MAQLLVSDSKLQEIKAAVDARARQIDDDTDELKALFEIRQSLGPNPKSNTGDEVIEISFDMLSKERAREVLADSTNRSLSSKHEETLQWLSDQI